MNSTLRGIGIGLGAQFVDERFTWYNPTYATARCGTDTTSSL